MFADLTVDNLTRWAQQWLTGIKDAANVPLIIKVCTAKPETTQIIKDILLFNLVINGGVLMAYHFIALPLVSSFYENSSFESPLFSFVALNQFFFFRAAFNLLWGLPILGLSFLINPPWLNKLASGLVPQSKQPPPPKNVTIFRMIAILIYENTFFIPFLLQSTLTLLIPFLGKVVNFTLLCWLYALYCFEYKWPTWDVMRRFKFIEDNWAYFVGFGMVVAAPFLTAGAHFGLWVGYAVWWIEFPFFMIAAIEAPEFPHCKSSNGNCQLTLFKGTHFLTSNFLNLIARVVTGGLNAASVFGSPEKKN